MNEEKKKQLKNLSNKIAPIFKFWNYPLAKISGINAFTEKAVLRPVVNSYTKHSKSSFLSYSTYPKAIEGVDIYSLEDYSEWAIIMQGPILYENDFTIDTIKLYKKLYKDVTVIVSTWIGVKQEFKDVCDNLNIKLVENREPESSGPLNINYQLVSSLAGMKEAEKLGCKYAIKTRNDQRFYARDLLQYFENLLNIFPTSNQKQRRIILTSYGMSYISRPFCLCDHFAAGYISDLLNYYSVKLDDRNPIEYKNLFSECQEYNLSFRNLTEKQESTNPYECIEDLNEKFKKLMCPEEYIAFNYCVNYCYINGENSDLYKMYQKFLANFIIIVDESQLNICWPKYLENSTKNLNEYDYYGKLDFKKWLNIYNKYHEKIKNEK